MAAIQIFNNATTGNSEEFKPFSKFLTFRLVINGTSTTPINAFHDIFNGTNNLLLKISGISGGGAAVKLQVKMLNNNDTFSDTGVVWSNDFAGVYYLK